MQNGLRWRARIRYLVLSALVVGLVASAATAAVKSQGQKRFVIGYAGAILSNPSVKANEDGVKAQAAKYGMEVVSTDANFNASKQISDIDTLIQRGVDAILMVPVNSQAVEPALQRARAKNIIVISREGEGRDPWTSAFNGTNFDSASAAAFFMAKRLGRGAKVAVIDGNPSTGLLRARNEGFRDGAKKAGLDVVNSQVNFRDSADGARPIVDGWRAKYGSALKGIFAYNDPSAIGAASAAGGGFEPMIVGYNGTPEAIAAIKEGKIAATYDISSAEQGQAMAYMAYQLLTKKAKSCPKIVNVPFKRFDRQNVGDWTPFEDRVKTALPVAIVQKGDKAFMLTGKAATQYRAKLKKRKLAVRC